MLRLLMLFVLLAASLAAPLAPQAAAQEPAATPAVAVSAEIQVGHWDVDYLVNHQWATYGSYPYYYQALNAYHYVQNQLGFVARIRYHH